MKKKILIVVFLFVMLFILVPKQQTYALTPVHGNLVQLESVTISYDGVPQSLTWLLMDDGYYYLDFDGSGLQSNGLFPLSNSVYTPVKIQSSNTNYLKFEFYDPTTGQVILFDLTTLLYVSILIEYDSVADNYVLEIDDTSPGNLIGYTYEMKDYYVRVYDLAYEISQQTDEYRKAWNDGWAIGWSRGNSDGYTDGLADGIKNAYNNGFTFYGYSPLTSYDYDTIRDHLYTNGFGASDSSSFSYVQGYSVGLVQNETDQLSLIDFIPGILGVLMGFVLQLASFEFLGISLLDILVAVVTIIGALIIFKIFIGK